MRALPLITFSAAILLATTAAEARGFDFGFGDRHGKVFGGNDGWSHGRQCGSGGGFGRGCGEAHRPFPNNNGTRVCYNIAGKPYYTSLPRCPIS